MSPKNDFKSSYRASLRQKAEEQAMATKIPREESILDIVKVIHELQVYKLELQMQNEELSLAKDRAELAEKKYSELYEMAPSGYITLTEDGDIVELNNSAARLLHKERSLLINNRFALFFCEKSKDILSGFLDRVFKNHHKETCEVVLKKSGDLPVYLNIDGIISKDEAFCMLTMVDVSKYRQAEESMFQLKLANESIKFKQSFLANISHEIRTPLTGILGMIDILEHTELTHIQKDYISILKHSGENLKEIIGQVLYFSQIEAGKIKLKPTFFASKRLLDETEMLYKGSIKPQVQFSTISDPKIPAFIYADESRIGQVINNLVSNALKFTSTGSVELRSVLSSPNPASKQIIIKIMVTDTGIGIPEDMRNKLFVPFSQIDNKETRDHEGTGLGLSICKEIVKLLGGEIGVVSEYQKGSTFWFTFPAMITDPSIRTVDKNGTSSSNTNGNHQKSLNILFAEDKAINQKVISLILSSMGHTITMASNGEQLLSLYKSGKFDLILMDINMPVMDGITATRRLKEKYRSLPPIVGLSANAFEGDRDRYMALGLDEYLTKPFAKEEFMELVTKLLD